MLIAINIILIECYFFAYDKYMSSCIDIYDCNFIL